MRSCLLVLISFLTTTITNSAQARTVDAVPQSGLRDGGSVAKLVERYAYDASGRMTVMPADCLDADVDCDGLVGASDLVQVRNAFGPAEPEQRTDVCGATAEPDGIVNELDLACVREQLGKGMNLDPLRAGDDGPKPDRSVGLHGLTHDHATGLLFARARYYHPQLGTWLQRDPKGYIDGSNLYTAFANNAVQYTDPMGTATKEFISKIIRRKDPKFEEKVYRLYRLMEYDYGFQTEEEVQRNWFARNLIRDISPTIMQGAYIIGPDTIEYDSDDDDEQIANRILGNVNHHYDLLSTHGLEDHDEAFRMANLVLPLENMHKAILAEERGDYGEVAARVLGHNLTVAGYAAGAYSALETMGVAAIGARSPGLLSGTTADEGARILDEFYSRELARQWTTGFTKPDLYGLNATDDIWCFIAGTPVLTESGPKPIEQIVAGEKVWGADPGTGEWKLKRVITPLVHDYDGDVITITVGDETIEATGNHPFWVTEGDGLADRPAAKDVYPHERAMTPHGRWVEASDLQIGDSVLLQSGEVALIEGLSVRHDTTKVYNIEVEDLHTYAVGEAGILVHNKPLQIAEIPGPSAANRRVLIPVGDPAPPVYRRGHPGKPVLDHIKARAAGGHPTDPRNLDWKPWEWNSRKGAREGQLLWDERLYLEYGLTPEDIDHILADEWNWIVNDVHARPVDPAVLDQIPAP